MEKKILFALFISIFINLLVLDAKIFGVAQWLGIESIPTPTPQTVAVLNQQTEGTCSPACVSQIGEATSSLNLGNKTVPVGGGSQVKEFFVPIGSITSSSEDWEDTGLLVIIDTAKYGRIKETYFEASANSTNNQIVYVRLYNVTDKHLVWNSELTFPNAQTAAFLSTPITLTSGNKAYKVQMKTQLRYTANLNQSRIRILTQ